MKLSSIKLAGFKSFVDPTVIPINSEINAVVGPNGCGKSNVIDAVRWVIGETSAKQLRGQSMSDVIFNGTSTRKPVGVASVELHFEDTLGCLSGEYAKFNTMSIKREVTRDGQSNYYINSTLSRRKDIIQAFLGTGLGPRSYAIIEQGMITRLIEAKPEELRIQFEEAAGVSIYRERRRETENRIRHTRENLDRVNDLCEELAKQQRHLTRQANAAERFKTLKEEERQLSAELSYLRWQALADNLQQHDSQITQVETEIEGCRARLTELDTAIETARSDEVVAREQQDRIQKEYYGLGAEIARLEQQIHDLKEQSERWLAELEQVNTLCDELQTEATTYQEQQQTLQEALSHLEPSIAEATNQLQQSQETLATAESNYSEWQSEWETFQLEAAKTKQQIEVSKTRLEHYRQQASELAQRKQALVEQMGNLSLSELQADINELAAHETEAAEKATQARQTFEAQEASCQQLQSSLYELQQKNQETAAALSQRQATHSSLEVLQQAALSSESQELTQWLQQQEISQGDTLLKLLQVDPKCQAAVELVMGRYLGGLTVNDLNRHSRAITELSEGVLSLVEPSDSTQIAIATNSLAAQVQGPASIRAMLADVLVADSLEQALQRRGELQTGQSFITSKAEWVGKHWLFVDRGQDHEQGMLARMAQINELQSDIAELERQLAQGKQQQQTVEQQLSESKAALQASKQRLDQATAAENELRSGLHSKRARLEALTAQQSQLETDIELVDQRIQEVQLAQQETELGLEVATSTQQEKEEQRQHYLQQRDSLQAALTEAQAQVQIDRQQTDQLQLQRQSKGNELNVLMQALNRNSKQLESALANQKDVLQKVDVNGEPDSELTDKLQEMLQQQEKIEQELHQSQREFDQVKQQFDQHEKQREQTNTLLARLQEQQQEHRIERQTLVVNQQHLHEQIQALDFTVETVQEALSEEANVKAWKERLETVINKISRLGPINLAAIDEAKSLEERKEHLDKQQADLNEALEILESAIRKIDKETKVTLKETFDEVNRRFQEIFPRVFGGGSARLELTDDDVLNAGVVVMAQPPGKRNTTIHVLSGGEKALTAISLTFALFQLNAAPFCILDEVDAPLDDLNVGRYCQLIKEMAKYTQFIVISHNKITIEAAQHLLGVTMQEAGVSRIVSVDIDQAVAMAE